MRDDRLTQTEGPSENYHVIASRIAAWQSPGTGCEYERPARRFPRSRSFPRNDMVIEPCSSVPHSRNRLRQKESLPLCGRLQTVKKPQPQKELSLRGRSPWQSASPKPNGFGRTTTKMATFWGTDCHVGLCPPRNDVLFRHAQPAALRQAWIQSFRIFSFLARMSSERSSLSTFSKPRRAMVSAKRSPGRPCSR